MSDLVVCPYCGDPVNGLLSECAKPQCLQRFLAEEMSAAARSAAIDDVEDACGWCGSYTCDDRERHQRYDQQLPATGVEWRPGA